MSCSEDEEEELFIQDNEVIPLNILTMENGRSTETKICQERQGSVKKIYESCWVSLKSLCSVSGLKALFGGIGIGIIFVLGVFLYVLLPLTMIVLGAVFINECPGEKMIPISSILIGCCLILLVIINAVYFFLDVPKEVCHIRLSRILICFNVIFSVTALSFFWAEFYFVRRSDLFLKDRSVNGYRCNTVLMGFWIVFSYFFGLILLELCLGFICMKKES